MTVFFRKKIGSALSAEEICPSQVMSSSRRFSKQIPEVIDCELVKKSDVLCVLILLWIC